MNSRSSDDAEKLGLHVGAQGADFVEEDGAVVGSLEVTFAVGDRGG